MADHTVTVESTLEALLVEKKYSSIRDILSTMNPADIASVFDGLEESRLPLLFRLLPKELAAETFVVMEPDAQELLIRGFSDSELREVLDELYVDDAVDIVEEMPANVVRRILSQADPDMRKDINEILRYPENSAGSIMTTEYVSLRPGMTVRRPSSASAARASTKRRSTPATSPRTARSSVSSPSRTCCWRRTTTRPSTRSWRRTSSPSIRTPIRKKLPACSRNTTSLPCRSWTRRTAWSAS